MSNQDRFAKFTERARKVLSLAQEESQRFQHNYIGTEHLLITLCREGQGIAARVLDNLGLTTQQLRRTTEGLFGRGDRIILGEIGLTADAKQAIEAATNEAQRLNHHYIGTEHLLLGLARVPLSENKAGKVLQHLGVSLEIVRNATMQLLSSVRVAPPNPAEPAPPSLSRTQYASARRSQHIPSLQQHPNPPKIGGMIEALAQDPLFSSELLTALRAAQEEARRFEHNYIGTEHQLLGLLHDTEGNAAKVLNNLGVELDKVRSAVEFIIGRGDRIVLGQIGLTPRAKKVLQLTADAAYTLKSDILRPEHLLIGLVYEGEGIGSGVLESLGVERTTVYEETLRVLGNK